MVVKMDVIRREIEKVDLKSPIYIEGLPGVGYVGKLVVDHLIKELHAKKIIEIYSKYFPPQVLIDNNSVAHLVKNEVYAWKNDKGGDDLLFLAGDFQSVSSEGHYELTNTYLDIAEEYNVKRIYTIGGYGVGYILEKPSIICAVNNESLLDELKGYNIEFKKEEPGGGIVGAAGLMLGLGALRGIEGICIMGVTSGYLVDPKSAQEVIKTLCQILDIEISLEDLEKRAEDMEEIIKKLKEAEYTAKGAVKEKDESFGYYI
ncbi:MAG: proteasome assembly chaperone family protein [Candidatus Methanoliparum thermophilum]|uniref:Proteasome assembly chaperone family protein n=1 Tax=Methanoliparum thermophilum TaxID=2491083 RepID=A0A520KQG7_METT2|nr:MAG: proteasome assembly chaperone family protein [Candidatus Methanoliparum thermophilum]